MPKYSVSRHAAVQPELEEYRIIPLTQGKNAIVDSDDFVWLSQWKWCAIWNPTSKTYYAQRRRGHETAIMHRDIMCCPCGEDVDHRNHDGLDNRKENLRRCDRGQNVAHQRRGGLKGVCKSIGKWSAYICPDYHKIHLGQFTTAEEAARAYDFAALCLFGEFAVLNFP